MTITMGINPTKTEPSKEVGVEYRGREYTVASTSPLDQFLSSVEALIVGLAVDEGLVKALWVENILIGLRAKPGATIAEVL